MVERSSEEVTPLKIHNVEMISIHCGAHRLALATSLAADSITFLKWFDSSFVLKNSGSGSWFAIGASLREPHIDENNVRNPYIIITVCPSPECRSIYTMYSGRIHQYGVDNFRGVSELSANFCALGIKLCHAAGAWGKGCTCPSPFFR